MLTLALLLVACGGSADDDSGSSTTEGDPATTPASVETCDDLCVEHGYDSHTEDEQDFEYHCYCDGDAGGDIDPTVCNDLCLELGWSGGYVEPAECWCA